MVSGADFKPILDNGEPVPGMFVGPGGRVVSKRNIVLDGRITTKTWECYTRLGEHGEPIGLFEFPVEKNPDARTVSRKASGGDSDLEEDLYLSKRAMNPDGTTRPVFRYTTPEDVKNLRAMVKANEAKAAAQRAANTPMAQHEAMGKAIAASLAGALAGGQKQTRMGAGNG